MSQPIDREGTFQGLIVEFGLREYDTGSLAVAIRAKLDTHWNEDVWEDWREFEFEASGFLYIIKKNGEPNNGQVESLVRFAGWDGTLKSISEGTWQPIPCQFTVKANEYQGQTSYRIEFINEHDRVPGQMSNVNDDKLKNLEARFGSQLRAIAGSAKRNASPSPADKMPKPKKAPAKAPEPAMSASVPPVQGDDIPF